MQHLKNSEGETCIDFHGGKKSPSDIVEKKNKLQKNIWRRALRYKTCKAVTRLTAHTEGSNPNKLLFLQAKNGWMLAISYGST